MSSVCRWCRNSVVYTSLCRGFIYLLKILYTIQDYPIDFFQFLRVFVWAGAKNWPISKKISQKWTAFHRMCVQSIHIFYYIDLPDVTASNGMPFGYIAFFFWYFQILLTTIHVWIVVFHYQILTDCVSN